MTLATRLEIDAESIALLKKTLAAVGYDTAQQFLRPDYFSSPFPHYEELEAQLPRLSPSLATSLRFFALGQTVTTAELEDNLGRPFVEAGLATNLFLYEEEGDAFNLGGFTLVSRFGQYFLVSANPYYPTFDDRNAAVYMGPDSLALANHLQRLGPELPVTGRALDLCCGSGIAGQSLSGLRRGLDWLAVDLSPEAAAVAAFNAVLNSVNSRYRVEQGDLYAPAGGQSYDLIVANPPFIPVPNGVDFPIYGAGGEDGLTVLRPILDGLGAQLSKIGMAVIYAEGPGGVNGPFVLPLLQQIATRDGLSIELTIFATATAEQALYTLGLMLSRLKPPRLPELAQWTESFSKQGIRHYDKYFIVARRGRGEVTVRSVARGLLVQERGHS
jgi:hypothetical protein